MKTLEKFENGMSIVQLEERFEMAAAGGRDKNEITLGAVGDLLYPDK